MKYLLDTNVIVNHLRGRKNLTLALLTEGAAISSITLAELCHGAAKSNHPEKSQELFEELIETANLEVIPVDQDTAYEFGKMKATLEKSGQKLEDFDLLIASCAKVAKLTLVTANIKHMSRIPDLTVIPN